jgi:hypothetical protein
VTPVVVARSDGSAPAFSSAFTTAVLPALLARCSGVYCPMRVTAATLAPA